MANTKQSEFIVLRHVYTFRTCSVCAGAKIRTRTFRKMNFVENCPSCLGTGQQRLTTKEEVSLAEALEEINSIT